MSLDLHRYAARIGYSGGLAPTIETLRDLHLAHATHIPFENLDVLLKRPIRLDLESLWDKLVLNGRGGYCFEQNALFAAVLAEAGFRVTRLAARVRMGAPGVRPRSHMLLAVEADGESWVADVGFGGDGLLLPLRLTSGEPEKQFAWTYRIIREGPLHVLQTLRHEGWFDLYSFTLEEAYPADYEVSNYYTSTHPQSPFTRMLLVQRPSPESRLLVHNRLLIDQRPGGKSEVVIPDDDSLLEVLVERFGLRFPEGTRFPYPDVTS